MAEQLTLDQTSEIHVDPARATPAQKWQRFVGANPHAKAAIVDTARQLYRAGQRITIAVVWEELRGRVHTRGDVYRWDNSLRAPAAGWLREEHPGLARHMRTRKGR